MNHKKIILSLALSCAIAVTPLSIASAKVNRPFSGTSRYDTALKIVSNGWTKCDSAVISSGNNGNLVDALTAAPLAKKLKAPIILTDGKSIDSITLSKLASLGVKNIYITSGSAVIGNNIENQLKNIGIKNINRLGGTNRFQTSINIAKTIGNNGTIMLARADEYADALSAAAIAAKLGMPILLTNKDSLSDDVKNYISSSKIRTTYVLGLQGAISDTAIKGLPSCKRLGGANRYETNIQIIKEFQDGLDFNKVYIASGEKSNLVDALAGSPLAANFSAPIILCSKTLSDTAANYLSGVLNSNSEINIFGGEGAVPSAVSDRLNKIQAAITSNTGTCSVSVKMIISPVLKQITVNSTNIPNCSKYKLEGSSDAIDIGQPITLLEPDNKVNIYFYSSSGNLVARGILDTSKDNYPIDITVQLVK
jgi:putative cell wall-binding protein